MKTCASRVLTALVAACAAACSVRAEAPPTSVPQAVVTAAARPEPAVAPEPKLSLEDALARAKTLGAAWASAPRWDEERLGPWLREEHLDEADVRRLLDAIARACLGERDGEAEACKAIADRGSEPGKAIEDLVELLAELAEPLAGERPSTRLLLRLDARGIWQAGSALERILERRMLAGLGACTAPDAAEVRAARTELADFAVIESAPRAKGDERVARKPTERELDDLAYFLAAALGSGAEIGRAVEDTSAKELPKDHPDNKLREKLREDLRAALLDGDLVRHTRAAEAYLRTLGYPGKLRMAEDGDERWGGAGVSFVLRDDARSAELLGRYDLAETLYRRADPGGGSCGTSRSSRRDDQIQGAIRSAEQQGRCRAAVADRLFAVENDLHEAYGTARLARAGFDVARLYAGALSTLGRDDEARLARALQAQAPVAIDALARFAKRGPEAWASRVRAIPGYAVTAGSSGIDALLAIAQRVPGTARDEAIGALGQLAEDRGWDPCIPSKIRFGFGRGSSNLERSVRSVMTDCTTRIDATAIARVVGKMVSMASDTDPGVREAVATALGRLGSPIARKTLEKLTRDPFVASGTICVPRADGPMVCGPNRPVQRAAAKALTELNEAANRRAEQRAHRTGP